MFELGVHEEYLSRIAEGLLEPSEMFQKIGEELSTEIANMSHSMSKMQTEMVKVLEGALGQVMVSANNRLAKQFETALQRQLAAPLESINLRLGSQLAKRPDSNAENIRKIVKAQTQSQAAGEVA